jgi:hypothetical protein
LVAIKERNAKLAAMAEEVERWLRLVIDRFSGSLSDITVDVEFGFLAENLGPASDRILRSIAGVHPRAPIRWEADCGLAIQQMEAVRLVADLRSVAALPPESKKCAGPGLAAACVVGGETRLDAIDSRALVDEIERRLQGIANGVNNIKEPGICTSHLINDCPTLAQYHAGTEILLRRVAEGHPDQRWRTAARRKLAAYLVGLADLSSTIQSDRAYWVDRIGGNRVEQICSFEPALLEREASELAAETPR